MAVAPRTTRSSDTSQWQRIDWAEHRRLITIGGRCVNLVDIGSGPPLLLLHGLGGNWQCWLENIPALARANRVIAPDLPGFGESELPAGEISIAAYARFARDLLDALRCPNAAVAGSSMGGQIACELALKFPAVVERLVLVSAAGIAVESLPDDRAERMLRRSDRLAALWAKFVVRRARGVALRPRARRVLLRPLVEDPACVSAPLLAELLKGTGKAAFAPALKSITEHRISARLSSISCPTLIVWGERDRITPARDARTFAELISGSELVIWPQTGHLSMIERATDFNELLERFLRR